MIGELFSKYQPGTKRTCLVIVNFAAARCRDAVFHTTQTPTVCYSVPSIVEVSVSVSASYCIPQCVRLIAGVCTHYVVYNISKKKNTVDKSKIKDKRKVKPKDKSWVKIGWRTKNRKGWCVQKR